MNILTTIQMKRLIRPIFVSTLLVVAVVLAFASKGGGGNKKKTPSFKNDFVPIRTTTGFTMRSGLTFAGSHITGAEKNDKHFSFNTLVTYQKGNTIFVMPYKYKVSIPSFNSQGAKTNFQMLNFKIKMHK